MSGIIESYRTNLAEAQRALAIARTVADEYKARDMIAWGRTPKGFEGWLVKGKKADDVYSNYLRARGDVEHWGDLLNQELKASGALAQDSRLPPETDD